MTFGEALETIKTGKKAQREGWNGAGQYVYYVPAGHYAPCTEAGKELVGADGKVSYRPYLALKTVQGDVVPWLASQSDLLSDDWRVLG